MFTDLDQAETEAETLISVLAAEAETLIFAETAAEDVVPHETESPLAGADGEILMPAVQ